MLNNREVATAIWLALIIAYASAKQPDIVRSAVSLARTLLSPNLAVPLLILVTYATAACAVAAKFGLWNLGVLKATVFWFAGPALVLFFESHKIDCVGRVRRVVIETIAASVWVQYLVGILVFALWVELILQPLLVVLVGVVAVARYKGEYKDAKRLAEWMLGLIGVWLIAASVRAVISERSDLDWRHEALEFAVPVWLTLAILPLVITFNLAMWYERAFGRLTRFSPPGRRAWKPRLAFALGVRANPRAAREFSGPWTQALADRGTLRDGLRVVYHFRAERSLRLARERERDARFERFAGVDGEDAAGVRLDRREFVETCRALRLLATVQHGNYERDRHYGYDALSTLETAFGSMLPPGPRIELSVSADRQHWVAWRQTITGWCFGIGASGPPATERRFDGPEPPNGYPGSEASWASQSAEGSINWHLDEYALPVDAPLAPR